MKYHVWFNQVNQVLITVKARTPEKALEKAQREWKREHSTPPTWYMEDAEGNEIE